MTGLRRWESPAGARPGDHLCWTFADAEEFAAAVHPFLDEGRRRGEQLLLTGSSRPALLQAVEHLPHRDELLASGQLEIRATDEIYGPSAGFDSRVQVGVFGAEADAALRRGRSGLRVAADITGLARSGPDGRRRLHAYERLVDALIGRRPLVGMCLYDASLGDAVLGPLAVLHPVQHVGDREPLGYLSGRGDGLALHGEVDSSLADDVLRALVDLASDAAGEVALDLAGLEFLDVAGARVLARAVQLLERAGVHLRLARPRRLVARCLDLFGVLEPEPA